jgi:uncharacterized protein YbbC (DUF1343 family)
MMTLPRVRTGLDVLAAEGFAPLRGLRLGLVTHPAAVDAELRHVADLLAAAPGVQLVALFGPEHGLFGEAQDLVRVPDGHDTGSGLRVHSLYGDTFESLRPTAEQLEGLDALVIDLQDVGSRYYTFQATMLLCLEAGPPDAGCGQSFSTAPTRWAASWSKGRCCSPATRASSASTPSLPGTG